MTAVATSAAETGAQSPQTSGGASVTGSTLVLHDGVDAGGMVGPLPVGASFTLNDSDAECFFDDEENAADDLDDELPPGMPAFGLMVPGFDEELPPTNPFLVRQNAYWRPGTPA